MHNEPQSASQTQEIIQELQEMSLDPTLDQCCRRDIESQIRSEQIRQTLQQHDRVDTRQRVTSTAICRDPGKLAVLQDLPQPKVSQLKDYEGVLSADHELEQLRRQRLRQLQAQAAVQQEQRQAEFGCLNMVQESKLMGLLSDPPGLGCVVVHLAVQGYEPCNALDECLDSAAAQYRGTYFARVVVSRSSGIAAQLQLPHGVPALLVCRDGAVLGKAALHQFGQHDIWEEEVLAYLKRFKVLSAGSSTANGTSRSAAAAGGRGGRRDGSSDADSDSDAIQAGDDWQQPCEVCGRTYAHTHIRAIHSSQHHTDEESSDLGDD